MTRDAAVRDFSLRILARQPLAYADAVVHDFAYGFSPVRGAGPEKYSPAYLKFQTYVRPDNDAYASIAALGFGVPRLQPGLAAFLAGYGRYCYVPGPVLAAGLVPALAGLVTGWRRRAGPTWPNVLLFATSAICVLIPAAAFATFDWRYQLPQLTLIPLAAISGFNAISSRRSGSSQPAPRSTGQR
jgi:hypothetical protein